MSWAASPYVQQVKEPLGLNRNTVLIGITFKNHIKRHDFNLKSLLQLFA